MYKRQVHGSADGPVAVRGDARQLSRALVNLVDNAVRHTPGGGPVSYTHLDVYKRQHLHGAAAHEPWRHPQGYDHGYPQRIVDHDVERREALARYQAR